MQNKQENDLEMVRIERREEIRADGGSGEAGETMTEAGGSH